MAAELARVAMPPGFGRDLARLLRNGVGVHHAGMLPRHRRLVERLTQQGALKVVSGTDTLGVGVNLPIRTVVFTRLYKFDGNSSRMLSAREFHQIAGRAGRAGYDTEGLVVAVDPEHETEYVNKVAKAGTDTKKLRKATKPAAPRRVRALQRRHLRRLADRPAGTVGVELRRYPGDAPAPARPPGRHLDHCQGVLLDNHEPRTRQRTTCAGLLVCIARCWPAESSNNWPRRCPMAVECASTGRYSRISL